MYGKEVASHTVPHTIAVTMPWFEGPDIGSEYLTAVDSVYKVPFNFPGTITRQACYAAPGAKVVDRVRHAAAVAERRLSFATTPPARGLERQELALRDRLVSNYFVTAK